MIKRSDILSIHIVLSESTHHLITASDLALLKPTALFINTSRGPIVDEQALVKILEEKKIAGAKTVIYNDGSVEDLETEVAKYVATLPSPN